VRDGQRRERLILFQATLSGNWRAVRIFVMDTEGNALDQCQFVRSIPSDARWLDDSGHGFPCLVVNFGPTHYLALLDDTFALVRHESSAGAFVPVPYPDHIIDRTEPERTSEEWEAALCSPDRAEVLRTLVWLGGKPWNSPRNGRGVDVEPSEDASLVVKIRFRPGVRTAVAALAHSDDRWLREAAQHAWEVIQCHDQ
jgi:hypothetical protein